MLVAAPIRNQPPWSPLLPILLLLRQLKAAHRWQIEDTMAIVRLEVRLLAEVCPWHHKIGQYFGIRGLVCAPDPASLHQPVVMNL